MEPLPSDFMVWVLSRDRIGIVAEVSGAISALGGDITDLRQSVLRGYFTMILHARFPRSVGQEQVLQAIGAAGPVAVAPLLQVSVQPADPRGEADRQKGEAHRYILTARGPDRVGFVAAVSSFCARNQLNILDLSTAVSGADYVMMLLLDVSGCDDLPALRGRLKAFCLEAELEAVLQHEAIFRATNEVDL